MAAKRKAASKRGHIGPRTRVWDRQGLWGAFSIGADCTIARFVEIGDGVRVGDRCKVEAPASPPPGVVLEDDVFVSHACLTNDRRPRAGGEWERVTTVVRRGASPACEDHKCILYSRYTDIGPTSVRGEPS